jgi:hypothetical protein
MKTGTMKQTIYIIGFIAFFGSANAQISAGIVAASVVNNTVVAPDVNLSAAFTNNAGTISWKAVAQIKVRRYELEKSADGESFSYITSVAGSNNNYSIVDENVLENMNYYRIKIVAADGNYMYSRVTLLNTKNVANEIKVLPTQINQKLFIWIPVNTAINKATISDASGRTVISNAAISNTTNLSAIETANLPAGLYNIRVQTSKGETIRLKFNKQS